MASSPIPEMGPLRAPQGIHLLLAVGVSAAFWNLAVFWVTGSGPSWPAAPLGMVYAVVLGLWAPWRQRTHQGPLLKLWFWVVATLALYGALALIEGRPWPETFGLNSLHMLWFLPGFLQGQLTALWAGQLTSRARLYQLIEGIPQGKALEDRVRDFQLDADFSRSNEATLSASLIVLCVATLAMATFSPFGSGGASTVLAVSFLTACLLIGVLLRTYRREMEALMYGRRFSLAEKLAPLGWSSLLLLAAGLGAWGLLSLGGPWVDWSVLFRGRYEPIPLPEMDERTLRPPETLRPGEDYRLAVLLALLEIIFRFRNILALVELLIRSATWLIPFAVVAFLLWPLARWLLSGGRETKGLTRRWWRLLVDQWRSFWAVVAGWWLRPVTTVEGIAEASNTREWLRSLFRRPALGRRVPFPPLVEAFLTLVRWAEPVTVYHRGETTREYLDRLAALVTESAADLILIRDLLDQELFGPRALDQEQRKAFLGTVAALTAAPPSHDSAPGVS